MASQNPSDQKTTPGAEKDAAKGQNAGATAGEKRDEKAAEPSSEPGPKILPTHYRGLPKDWEKNRQRKYYPRGSARYLMPITCTVPRPAYLLCIDDAPLQISKITSEERADWKLHTPRPMLQTSSAR